MFAPGFLIILFAMGRYYYRLAKRYDKNKFVFGLLGAGIGIFALGELVAGIVLIVQLDNSVRFNNITFFGETILLLAICIATIVIPYKLIEKSFKKNILKQSNPDILDM